MKILENILLKNLTTMRLGGPARYVIEIEEPEEIKTAHEFALEKNLPIFILGGGANIIAKDEGFPGVIIKSSLKGIDIDADSKKSLPRESVGGCCRDRRSASPVKTGASDSVSREGSFGTLTHITAFSGTIWDDVVAFACNLGLTGIEALSKIPGLTGAAPVQNIGAYGQELLDTFSSARVYDFQERSFKTLTKSDLNFSYRHSILNTTDKNRYFVISVTLELKEGKMERPFYASMEKYISENHCTDFSPAGIRDIVSKIRAAKLPDPAKIASAGSFFKNIYLEEAEAKKAEEKGIPVYYSRGKYSINSGWLIEQAGLKGQLIHGMRVSDKAALILINESAQGYEDLDKARAEIIATVKDKFDFILEQEPVEL